MIPRWQALCCADKYEVESARIAGDSCIMASGKQLSSGCAVVLKFFVDEDAFSHLKRFHHQARDTQFIPGTPPTHLHPSQALGSGCGMYAILMDHAHCIARYRLHGGPQRVSSNCVMPGVLDMFETGEVALGSGASPACIVSEAGQYSLAHYMARMERNPSAARQKSTLTQLLEAVAYLHGRSMVRLQSPSKWRACKP